jgi:3-ketosteroid 9alpha-monooxygenase subunit B
MPDHGFHPLRIARIVPETADARSFVLDVPEELKEAFAYEAGQFCTFRMRVDGELLVRCYSMSSSPATDDELQVTVKRTPGGAVSNFMHDHLAEGDTLEATRPAGVFCLGTGAGEIVAFSAGSGITPVLSLLKTALSTTARRVRLFYANRDHEAVIFAAELDALSERFEDRFTVTHHLDVDEGLVQPAAVERFRAAAAAASEGDAAAGEGEPEFFICGPGPFMEVVEKTLLAGGAGPERIHIERFTPPEWLEIAESALPSDDGSTATRVTIELDGRVEATDHRPGTTILQTARQMGLNPPFSCESGSCATCMARLVTGTAAMLVNNALTDDEVAEGWILTCQGVPTSPSVHAVYSYEEG